MNKVIVFGSTGNLGKQILLELKQRNYAVTAVVRNNTKAQEIKAITTDFKIADVMQPASLAGICNDYDIIISSLGKSVSINDNSKPSFVEVDLDANSAILSEAVKSGVKKFIYVSALGAENYLHLDYFKVHHEFSQKLIASGLDYSIIKPPALFSAFLDLIAMAKKGQLVTLGKGDKQTNPIYEGDLAKVCVDSIEQVNAVICVGGKEVLTRKAINEIIQRNVNPKKKVRTVPLGLVKAMLPLIKLVSKNRYDKFAFFTEVMQHDVLAPQVGEMRLEEYVKMKIN